MGDVGHEVAPSGLESFDGGDIAGQQQPVLLSVGNKLGLQDSVCSGHPMQRHGHVPCSPFHIICKGWVPEQVENVAALVGGQAKAQVLCGPLTGVIDLVVNIEGHHPIGHGLGGTSKARQGGAKLLLLALIRSGQSMD